MKAIEPIEITDASLATSNIPETDYDEFEMGATYTTDDVVMIATGLEILTLDTVPAGSKATASLLSSGVTPASGETVTIDEKAYVFKTADLSAEGFVLVGGTYATAIERLKAAINLQADLSAYYNCAAAHYSVNATAATASKIVITALVEDEAANSYVLAGSGATLTWSAGTMGGGVDQAWDVGDLVTGQTSLNTCRVIRQMSSLTYEIRERTGDFTLGEVIGVTGEAAKLADQGAAHPVVTAATDNVHRIYESLVEGNTKKYPPTDSTAATPSWLDLGATNRWAAFDEMVGSQSTMATMVMYGITLSTSDSIALLNVEAQTVQIVIENAGAVEVYNETFDMFDTSLIYDWYTYFFEDIIMKHDMVVFDLPSAIGGTMTITITYNGSVAKVGLIVLGNSFFIGRSRYDVSLSINDYSIKEADAFGNYSILLRAYSRKMSCNLYVLNDDLDDVYDFLSYYRSTPLIWVHSEDYASMILYGFYKDFEVVIPYVKYSDCSLEIEGLI